MLLEEHYHEAADVSYADITANDFDVVLDDVVIKSFLNQAELVAPFDVKDFSVIKHLLQYFYSLKFSVTLPLFPFYFLQLTHLSLLVCTQNIDILTAHSPDNPRLETTTPSNFTQPHNQQVRGKNYVRIISEQAIISSSYIISGSVYKD